MSDTATRSGESRSADAPANGSSQVDIKALTEKVYQLMLADLRLTQARSAHKPRRKGK